MEKVLIDRRPICAIIMRRELMLFIRSITKATLPDCSNPKSSREEVQYPYASVSHEEEYNHTPSGGAVPVISDPVSAGYEGRLCLAKRTALKKKSLSWMP